MGFTLYKLNASPPARSVLMTIEILGIKDVEYVDVDFFTGAQFKEEFVKINPQHTIPCLKDDDGFVLWDSHAICTYLVNKYAKSDELYPADIRTRAQIDQKLHFDTGVLFPTLRATTETIVLKGEKTLRPENLEKVVAGYEFMEKFLTGPWLVGDTMTLADICCVSSVSTMHYLVPIDEKKYPKITAWIARCAENDFYQKHNVPGLKDVERFLKSKLA